MIENEAKITRILSYFFYDQWLNRTSLKINFDK